jgi:hypothetical protein
VRKARQAHDRAGQSRNGREAAWNVLCEAGMVLLHGLMNELQVQVERKRKPRVAFYWPERAMTVIVSTNWRVSIVPD